jgi:hypothetical protein
MIALINQENNMIGIEEWMEDRDEREDRRRDNEQRVIMNEDRMIDINCQEDRNSIIDR